MVLLDQHYAQPLFLVKQLACTRDGVDVKATFGAAFATLQKVRPVLSFPGPSLRGGPSRPSPVPTVSLGEGEVLLMAASFLSVLVSAMCSLWGPHQPPDRVSSHQGPGWHSKASRGGWSFPRRSSGSCHNWGLAQGSSH